MNPAIVFAIIVIIIWTLSGVATWVNKQQEQERRRRLREQMAQVGVVVPDAPRVPPAQTRPMPQSQRRVARVPPELVRRATQRAAAVARAIKPSARQREQRIVRATAPAEAPTPPVAVIPPLVTPPKPAPSRSRADARALARWLNPATLRQQFILTEIFQPPLALRERREL